MNNQFRKRLEEQEEELQAQKELEAPEEPREAKEDGAATAFFRKFFRANSCGFKARWPFGGHVLSFIRRQAC